MPWRRPRSRPARARGGQWRNRLVIARRAGATGSVVTGRIAATDPTPGSDLDGPAILQKLAILRKLKLGQNGIWGVIDTDEVAYLLLRGQVDVGLLHMTDIRANPGLGGHRDGAGLCGGADPLFDCG